MDEDPRALLNLIKKTFKIFEFSPPNAKDYELTEAELFKDLHAKFSAKGFEKMPKGMTGLDSG